VAGSKFLFVGATRWSFPDWNLEEVSICSKRHLKCVLHKDVQYNSFIFQLLSNLVLFDVFFTNPESKVAARD